jgi:GNAT superfamily N-acetyltransferase
MFWMTKVSPKCAGDLSHWGIIMKCPCAGQDGYVRRTHHGQGVMGALIEAAIAVTASAGAPALEAYPVDTAMPATCAPPGSLTFGPRTPGGHSYAG